jgi:Ser/Thr protein kinase RdoA (MazF antagonist)
VDATLDHASAALAAARGAWLAADRAEVVSVAANILVRLDPGPVWAEAALPEALPAIERALTALGAVAHRIVHGDSHPGSVLWTADGPLWSDWEDAPLGPLEWDLACLVTGARVHGNDLGSAEAAHGGPFDEALLDACVDAGGAGRGVSGGDGAW